MHSKHETAAESTQQMISRSKGGIPVKMRHCARMLALLTVLTLTGCKSGSSVQETGEAQTARTSEQITVQIDETGTAAKPETEDTAEPSAERETTGTSGSSASAGETGTAASSGGTAQTTELQQAEAFLLRFLDAAGKKDQDAVKKRSDVSRFAAMYKATGVMGDAALSEIEDMLLQQIFSDGGKGKIVRCGENPKLFEEYLQDYRKISGETDDADGSRELLEIVNSIPVPDHLYVFEYEPDGLSSMNTRYYVVSQCGSELLCDLTASSFLPGNLLETSVRTANSRAKSLTDILNSAIREISVVTGEANNLNGTFTFTGADFAGAKEPKQIGSRDDLLAFLKNRVNEQMRLNARNAVCVKISVQNGTVTAAVFQESDKEDPVTGEAVAVYGTYPKEFSRAELLRGMTPDQALQFAAK